MSGGVYPAFGLVFALTIQSFQATDPHVRRVEGDRNALYFFIIAIVATLTMGIQVYLFSKAAARLTAKLRSLSFKAILRQDSKPMLSDANVPLLMYLLVEFFDKEENSVRPLYCLALRLAKSYFKTGALTANLSDNPQKVNGLAGITLGT